MSDKVVRSSSALSTKGQGGLVFSDKIPKEYIVYGGMAPDGIGALFIYRFENNMGVSILKSPESTGGNYGLWEVVMLYFDDWGRELRFVTEEYPNGLIGGLKFEEVLEVVERVKNIEITYDQNNNNSSKGEGNEQND